VSRLLISGATGLVGRHLVEQRVGAKVLTRNPQRWTGGAEAYAWDPLGALPPAAAFDGVDVVVHLAGEPLAEGRWTADKKQRIQGSRVLGTRHLVQALGELSQRPKLLITASAVGYYGDRGDELLDESSSPGTDFLAQVCCAWEHEALQARTFGIRVVCLRLGMVLAAGEGALARMLPAFRWGVGARLGDGKQWMSWVHVKDLVRLVQHACERNEISGPMNAVAPGAVTNAEFSLVLAKAVHRPLALGVGRHLLRLGFGEVAEVLLASQRVVPRVAQQTGFQFEFPELTAALRSGLV
jgi:uncharacterized protein